MAGTVMWGQFHRLVASTLVWNGPRSHKLLELRDASALQRRVPGEADEITDPELDGVGYAPTQTISARAIPSTKHTRCVSRRSVGCVFRSRADRHPDDHQEGMGRGANGIFI
jgi:hypothetical protein